MERRPIAEQITTAQRTEAGDIARSLEGMLKSQYMNQDFESTVRATRFNKVDIEEFANLNYLKVVSLLNIVNDDLIEKFKPFMGEEELFRWQEANALKKLMDENAWVVNYAEAWYWMKMYATGLVSWDGGSRFEGMTMVTGATARILGKDDLSLRERFMRRLTGRNLAFTG